MRNCWISPRPKNRVIQFLETSQDPRDLLRESLLFAEPKNPATERSEGILARIPQSGWRDSSAAIVKQIQAEFGGSFPELAT